ncbi:uncharacterized protein LOC116257375 isoform X2 [Nymphaea colorata]|uniref:uncharacterized protein LOC116257375 isoform X2 n=1 Tax=Nymphaea colorata TaxID=210225 RepID=UPI00129DE44A|nr:uncharacterized protein LOC116257375 isoform X2 [Nymphaea colorata]
MPEIIDLDEHSSLFGAPLSRLHLQEDEEIEEGENKEFEGGEDEEEEEQESDLPVTLGFVEKPKNPISLLRQFFPCKAGGAPAWLDPINLPYGNATLCGFCGVPLQFLIQVYAPISEKESTFHRSLFVFMCTSMECLRKDQATQRRGEVGVQSRSVKVFRCQLPRANPFYSNEPPRYDGKDAPLSGGAALCYWCTTWKGEKICGSCRKARYCSEKHQVLHWRAGHKIECRQISTASQASHPAGAQAKLSPRIPNEAANSSLWEEYEIVNDDESTYDEVDKKEENYESSLVTIGNTTEHLTSLLDKFEGDEDKKHWASFQERIARAPDQVIRYCRDVKAEPLWPGVSGQPSKADVPNCSFCHSPRYFEFQVLSQLLYYFQVSNDSDSLDWATIAVYTCAASCEASTSYCEEFAWVQLCS